MTDTETCARCRRVVSIHANEYVEGEAIDGGDAWICGGCVTGQELTQAADDASELPADVTYGPAEIAERYRYAGRRVLDDYAIEAANFLRLIGHVRTPEVEEAITRSIAAGNEYTASLYAQAATIDGETPNPPTLSLDQIGARRSDS